MCQWESFQDALLMRVEFQGRLRFIMPVATTLLAVLAHVAEDTHPNWQRRSSLNIMIIYGD
jgi:hypothetical protein